MNMNPTLLSARSFCQEPRGVDKPIAVLTYEQLERWIHSLQDSLATEGFACVIGILRGGAPLALMVSHTIGVPVVFLRYERSARTAKWDSCLPVPPAGSKVLLCEDIAGSGHTLADCTAFLQGHGLAIKILTAAYDELSRIRPDYGIDAVGYFASFPWERHAYTDAYRADWQRTGAGRWGELQPDDRYAAVAVDLDGVLFSGLPTDTRAVDLEREAMSLCPILPDIDVDDVRMIVSDRPECDRSSTEDWLIKHGFGHRPLVMRGSRRHAQDIGSAVVHKVEAAVKFRCTVFIEGDLQQAILISEQAPLLKVVWWDAASRTGKLVGAQSWKSQARGD